MDKIELEMQTGLDRDGVLLIHGYDRWEWGGI